MAIDGNFLAFLIPALIVVLAAAVGFPSKNRIELDPSTAYGGGKRALIVLASILALVTGLILALLGGTQDLEELFAGINMVHVGGISLIIMGVVLLATSAMISRQIRRARRGAREQVLEVAALPVPQRSPTPGGAPPPRPSYAPPRDVPPRDLPPRDLPPRGYPPREYPPRESHPRQGIPPPRDLPPRPAPPNGDGVPPPPPKVKRRPPPPRYPPPE
jgi:hypothetical protein